MNLCVLPKNILKHTSFEISVNLKKKPETEKRKKKKYYEKRQDATKFPLENTTHNIW